MDCYSFRQTTGAKSSVQTTGAKPSLKDVESYCSELKSNVRPGKFFEYYSERDWMLGGEPVNDWKALFRLWDKNEKRQPTEAERARNTRSKMAICGEDMEFTRAVEEFTNGK